MVDPLRRRVQACIDASDLDIHYQPIVATRDGTVAGVEALARFRDGRPPDVWFAEATRAGAHVDLELLAVRRALEGAKALPEDVYVAVNVSPTTAVSPALADLILAAGTPVLLELTEHEEVADDAVLSAALRPLRLAGVRLAADDTGSGYAGLTRLLNLGPDCIKLDRALIHRVDADPAKRALASAVADFARQIGAYVVAEGVETEDELLVLTGVGIQFVQGYYLARPGPMPATLPKFPDLYARRVLVVDDDPIVRSVLRVALDKGGFEVVGEAVDGAQALDLARVEQPDIILLDVVMPTMGGDQALPILRILAPQATVVLLSGRADLSLLAEADGFIDKDIDVTNIAELLQGILRHRTTTTPSRTSVASDPCT
jgi:EAL domain-containing protein (putative c-di-GMP-specific phosphodiesterase class I)/CheY-like chemotaxis protein